MFARCRSGANWDRVVWMLLKAGEFDADIVGLYCDSGVSWEHILHVVAQHPLRDETIDEHFLPTVGLLFQNGLCVPLYISPICHYSLFEIFDDLVSPRAQFF